LFPEPLAPISETKSPFSMVRLTPSKGRIVSSPLAYSLVRLLTSTSDMDCLLVSSVVCGCVSSSHGRLGCNSGTRRVELQCGVLSGDVNPRSLRERLTASDDQLVGRRQAADHLD